MKSVIFRRWLYSLMVVFCFFAGGSQVLAVNSAASSMQYQYSGDVLPKNLIALNSTQGRALLQGKYAHSFLGLMSYFVTEKGLAYCGIASSVMVLNDLNMVPPLTPEHAPYKIFNQDNFFNSQKILAVITPAQVGFEGVSLDQLTNALRLYAAHTHRFYAGKVTLSQFRKAAIAAINSKTRDIIVNFCRKNIHEIGCGHFSPLAAYNKKADRFLLLDVARYKYPPVWVKATELFTAMDTGHKKTRGYIIVGV